MKNILLRPIRARGARLLLPLALLVLPAMARADVTVSGTVVDQKSHQPIAHAHVVVKGSQAGVTTDDDGHFSVSAATDFANLVVSRVGYARLVVAVGDKSQPVTIELVPAELQLRQVEITGRAIATRDLRNAQSVGQLTAQDLERGSGLSLENSINTLPGVFMQSRTPWGGAHITIRGYYPNYSQNSNGFGYQTFLNHIPVTDASGFTVLDDVDFSSLGSVEVIKGPASSRYGSSIAGTVNLMTARPQPGQSGVAFQAVGGSHELLRHGTTIQSGSEDAAVLASYGHQWYSGFRPNDVSRKDFARFTGDFRAGARHRLSAYFSYGKSFEQLSGEIDSVDFYGRQAIDNPVYALNNSRIEIQSARSGFTDDYQISDRVRNESTVFTTAHTMAQPFAHGFTNTNRFSFGARSAFDYHTQAGAAKIGGTLGGQFQRTNLTSNGYFLPRSSPSDQENYATNYFVYSEWTAELPSDVTVTVGGAVARNEFGVRNLLKNGVINDTTTVLVSSFASKITPRASVLKAFSDKLAVYGSVSAGYTPPSLSSFINSDNTVNTGLEPETATQYEIGSKGSLAGHRLSYQLALFDLENANKLVSQKVGAVSSTVNVGKQRNQGAELTLSVLARNDDQRTLSLLRPWLSYTYNNFKYVDFKSDNNANASTVDFSGNEVARVPRNVVNLGLDAATNFGLYAFGSYQWVDKAYVTFDNSTSVKSYSLLSAKTGYRRKIADRWNLDLSAGGDNLLGSTYYTFIFVGPNYKGLAQPKDGGTGDGYILPGSYKATVYGSLQLTYDF